MVSLVAILIGFITFNTVPTPIRQTEHTTSSSSSNCEEGYDNPVATTNDTTNHDVAVSITTEEEGDKEEQHGDGEKEEGREEEEIGKRKRASGSSQIFRAGMEDEDAVGCSTKM